MARSMKIVTLSCAVLTAVLIGLYVWLPSSVLLSLIITAGTFFYHFAMRLTVGTLVNAIMKNRGNARKFWFRPRAWEKRLYARLGVRKWRDRMPTYDPALFSSEIHSYSEILGANCQAEVVHEVIMLLSFVPLAAVPLFGALWVFLITSILAAAYDALFVIMQRYARPHLMRALTYTERQKETKHDQSRTV